MDAKHLMQDAETIVIPIASLIFSSSAVNPPHVLDEPVPYSHYNYQLPIYNEIVTSSNCPSRSSPIAETQHSFFRPFLVVHWCSSWPLQKYAPSEIFDCCFRVIPSELLAQFPTHLSMQSQVALFTSPEPQVRRK